MPVQNQIRLNFALGKAMHDAGRWDEAFGHYAAGNSLRLKSQPYDPDDTKRAVDRAIAFSVRLTQKLQEKAAVKELLKGKGVGE